MFDINDRVKVANKESAFYGEEGIIVYLYDMYTFVDVSLDKYSQYGNLTIKSGDLSKLIGC